MAALGELAKGIAHEINNPIAIIGGIAEVLRDDISQKSEIDPKLIAEKMDQIIENSRRIEEITKGVQNFSIMHPNNIKTCVAGDIVSKSVNMARPYAEDLKTGVLVDGNGLEEEIQTDPQHVAQILVNLLHNAFDACKNIEIKKDVEITVNRNGNSVLFCVTDHGEGIPEENLPKVFDPFFTTRSPGKGTGLGLAISNRIIHGLGGRITVSAGSAGTAFTISIPVKAMRR
jgi:two-component system NtrC family sensor kinase